MRRFAILLFVVTLMASSLNNAEIAAGHLTKSQRSGPWLDPNG